MTGDAASATWLQTNHLVFTWIFSNAAGLAVTLASAAAVAAVARGWFRAALVLIGVAVAAGWSGLRYPPELWAYLTAAGILAVLARRPPATPRRRAWPWLLAVLLWLAVDPRPAIAAAVYIAPLLGGYLVTTVQYPPTGMAWWEVGPPLAIATVTGTLVAASAARARQLSRL